MTANQLPLTPNLGELLLLMERLRAVDGCPWDRAQTPESIARHTIEEAYEVADAAERGEPEHLKDELGDLLFQVVFQAQMAREAGRFDFDAVAAAIRDKLVRRHPHLFGTTAPIDAAAQSAIWENIKAEERAATATSALDGVSQALPALLRACKLSKRAARVGFDFARADETADKVAEELAEVLVASAAASTTARTPSPEVFEEVGDLLFAAANLARKLEVDAESALRAANGKFERRFRGMEELARRRGLQFEHLDLPAQEALWQEVKRAE